jgi:hypothetical protein
MHWSYSRACRDEYFSPAGPYCPHPEHYRPQCARHHKLHDLRAARRDKALRRKANQLLLW